MSNFIKKMESDTRLGQIINSHYLGERSHYIEVGQDKIFLPGKFEQFLERIREFEVYDDDVFILAFPKSGSRWVQEMVWLILNNLDFETARSVVLCRRSPLLDLEALFDKPQHDHVYFDLIQTVKRPRCLRTHLHWPLLPVGLTTGTKQAKMIVVIRNPEDICTSYYYQSAVLEGYTGSWDDFCELFLEGKVAYGPYWNHVLGLWKQNHNPNIMYINYNKMKNDLASSVRDVAKFLGKNLSDQEVEKLCNYLTFDNLKNCPTFSMQHVIESKNGEINPFIRTGEIGDHKNIMSAEVQQKFQEQRNKYLKGTDLNLD